MSAYGILHGNVETGISLNSFRAARLKRLHITGGFVGEW